MKPWLMLAFSALLLITAQTASAKTLQIEVHGMTCAFCVDSLERKLTAMPSVTRVRVSLENKIVRLETTEESPDTDAIEQAILDAGFTPTKVSVLPDTTKGRHYLLSAQFHFY